jgi:hypothetical protein
MPEITESTVINKIYQGIKEAQVDYERSTVDWLCNAPEYLLTVYIYRSLLHSRTKKYLTFEERPSVIEDFLKIARRGPRHPKWRFNGRCDLLLWSSGDRPRAIIEVKRHLAGYSGDIERLARLLHRGQKDAGLEFGVFACCLQEIVKTNESDARRRIEGALRKAQQVAESIIANRGFNISFENRSLPLSLSRKTMQYLDQTEEKRMWSPVCFLLKPR